MQAAIEIDRLRKVYAKRRSLLELVAHPLRPAQRVTALDEVSLTVWPGEVFGILGPNGAGKTTLLKVLSGLVTPTAGAARVAGFDVARHERAVQRSIGLVQSDERSFYWRLSGRENLRFFAMLNGLKGAGLRRRCDELLEEMEISPRADQLFMSYPTGFKQRLAIARSLLHDPPVIFLDEPTRSLDPVAAKHVRTFVLSRLSKGEGKTLLLATHNLTEAEEMCDRLAVLHEGRVLRQGTLQEVTAGLPGGVRYTLRVAGMPALPADARWSLAATPAGDGLTTLTADLDRHEKTLSALLSGILSGGGTILSCSRAEPALQEVFDLIEPPRGAARGEAG